MQFRLHLGHETWDTKETTTFTYVLCWKQLKHIIDCHGIVYQPFWGPNFRLGFSAFFVLIFNDLQVYLLHAQRKRLTTGVVEAPKDSSDMGISKFSKIMISESGFESESQIMSKIESPSSSAGASRHGQPAWLPTLISRSRQLVFFPVSFWISSYWV